MTTKPSIRLSLVSICLLAACVSPPPSPPPPPPPAPPPPAPPPQAVVVPAQPEDDPFFIEEIEPAAAPEFAMEGDAAEPSIVTVHFGTTRKLVERGRGGPLQYTDDDSGTMTYGVTEVSVPPASANVCGKMEDFRFRGDPRKHVIFSVGTVLPEDAFTTGLKAANGANDGRALIYVHGHSVSFENASRRAASLHQDLTQCFDAPVSTPVVFSWPAKSGLLNSLFAYKENKNRSEQSTRRLREFLVKVQADTGARQVDIVAHSMGASMVAEALKDIELIREDKSDILFGEVIFAAPDVDRATFADRAADFGFKSAERPGVAGRVTLYTSDNDKALKASSGIWASDRAGLASPRPPLLLSGVDTVDASAVTTDILGLNHSFFGEKESIVSDIAEVLRGDAGPGERGLAPARSAGGLPYWLVQPVSGP